MASVTVRTGGAGIDTRDFKDVTRALRRAVPQVNRDLHKGLRAAGELVAVEARVIAGKHSRTIPSTIKTRTAGATVEVRAGGGTVAIAGLFELGNTGGRKSARAAEGGVFRHPVFGSDTTSWQDEAMHPFLAPAAAGKAREVEARVVRALDEASRTIVFGR